MYPIKRLPAVDVQWLAEKKLIEKRAQLEAVDKLKPIADELGCSLAQLALAWYVGRSKVVSRLGPKASLHAQFTVRQAPVANVN